MGHLRGLVQSAALLCLLACALASGAAHAHESDYSYLRLEIHLEEIQGEWEVDLRDTRLHLGLSDDTGSAAKRELLDDPALLLEGLAGELRLVNDGAECPLELGPEVRPRGDGTDYLVVPVRARCAEPVSTLRLDYQLLFDLDEAHRCFLAVEDARMTHIGTLRSGERSVEISIHQPDRWREFRDYTLEGIRHIATGYDHLAFLLALLLVAPLLRVDGAWVPRERLGAALLDVARVVTAFTVAHAITLSAAVLGVIRLPPRWVEAAIAASVLAAAWNNLRPFFASARWTMAAAFGLVHGLGFASALSGLGLPRGARGFALFSFNVGVEVGQLAFVAAVVPLLWLGRRTDAFRTWCVGVGSFAIAWLALIWLVERVLGWSLLP